MDRAADFESVGWAFESLQGHHKTAVVGKLVKSPRRDRGECAGSSLANGTIK